jgi:serine/threonine-protein kinase HipA
VTPRPTELAVSLYDTRLATLVDRSRTGLSLRWEPDGLERWPINSTVMSVLLPLTPSAAPAPARVRAFFAGLLPEGDARTHLAVEAGVEPDDVMGMLASYGRDVAGALVIGPADGGLDGAAPELVPIDDTEIRRRLERADSNDAPLGVVPGVTSLSLAGMQPKIALHRTAEGQWRECRAGAPSTHIVKPGRPGARTAGLIHNEAYCLRLAPIRKFQYGRPLPSLRSIAAVLEREYASRVPLPALTAFNVAIGNTDAHAKNISVRHDPDGSLELAPAYDVSPHRHYSFSGRRAAMSVNGGDDIDALTVADLVAEGIAWGLREHTATTTASDTLDRLQDALADGEDVAAAGVEPAAHLSMTRRVTALLADRPAGSPPDTGSRTTTAVCVGRKAA